MGKEEMNFDATTPRYLVNQRINAKRIAREDAVRKEKRIRATIALAVTTVPFILFSIWAGKHLFLATHKVAGETAVVFSSQAKTFDTPNAGNVIRIFIVGSITSDEWARRRQLVGLGYEVEVIPRRGQPVVYRADSSLGSDVFESFGALADNLEALSIAAGVKE